MHRRDIILTTAGTLGYFYIGGETTTRAMPSQETQTTIDDLDATPNDVLCELADNFYAAANEFADDDDGRAEAYRHAGDVVRETVAEHSPDA